MQSDFPALANVSSEIIDSVLSQDRRLLLYGPPGSGKSTLARQLAEALAQRGRACQCLGADPGSPAFGVPGTLALGQWEKDHWHLIAVEGLGSLDAGRFRLPLLLIVQQLLRSALAGVLLIDAPGVVRGASGSELFTGLVQVSAVDAVLSLYPAGGQPALPQECAALGVEVYAVPAAAAAQRPGKRARARRRTRQWDAWLGKGIEQQIDLASTAVLGTPPPTGVASAWSGRQVVLLYNGRTRAIGEAQQLLDQRLTLRLPAPVPKFDALLLRDARRSADGMFETAARFSSDRFTWQPSADLLPPGTGAGGVRPAGRVGALDVALINGVFGDPLLHVRQRHSGRSLLFDLGEGARLGARVAHQVSDVFITHAHLDHIGGFLWLLRSRMGDFPPCRLYGPPGLAQHIAGFIQGIVWDRIGQSGPVFEVAELHGDSLHRFRLQAGVEMRTRPMQPISDAVILDERGFRVRAVMLDHRHTPVLAFSYEPVAQLNVRKDRLRQRGLEPGPWLNRLKQHLLSNETAAQVDLPDGSTATAGDLGAELILTSSGKKIIYSTDFSDNKSNRTRLIELAQQAHTLFCESTFAEADAEQARRTGHLTTRACAEIAAAAGVA
ncbi:MAG: Clp1/GlmU family protein, partial [Thiogranum sp.]|nr:Clp1/GlmU family protein [Thiogranum sp.]